MPKRDWTFLIVDDNDLDVERVERVFKRLALENRLERACDGIEALDRIRGTGDHAPLEAPFVLLMDLNMPRMNGIELLDALADEPEWAKIPIFVLSTSDRASDVEAVTRRGVQGYLVKPLSTNMIESVLAALEDDREFSAMGERMGSEGVREVGAASEGAASSATREVVLVDDDAYVGLAFERALRGSEWKAVVFSDPERALVYLSENKPEKLVVDILMPRMDGDELLDQLAEAGRLDGVEVFVSSSVTPIESVWKPFEARDVCFVLKDDLTNAHSLLQRLAGTAAEADARDPGADAGSSAR